MIFKMQVQPWSTSYQPPYKSHDLTTSSLLKMAFAKKNSNTHRDIFIGGYHKCSIRALKYIVASFSY